MKKNEKTNQINKKSKTEQTNMSHHMVNRGRFLSEVNISNLNSNISTYQTNLLISLLLWKMWMPQADTPIITGCPSASCGKLNRNT